MIVFTSKGRAKEALQRGTKAILIGGFFHVQHAAEFGLNEQASSWLYTEALAHQIYVLSVIANNKLTQKYKWATPDYVIKCINEAIIEYEIKEGFTPGAISSVAFRRCTDFDSLSRQERIDGEHYWQSAKLVKEVDPKADEEKVAARLESVAWEYFNAAERMFQ